MTQNTLFVNKMTQNTLFFNQKTENTIFYGIYEKIITYALGEHDPG